MPQREKMLVGGLIAVLKRAGVVDGTRRLGFDELIEIAGKYALEEPPARDGEITLTCRVCPTTHKVSVAVGWSRAPLKALAYVCSQACRDAIFAGKHNDVADPDIAKVREAHIVADLALSKISDEPDVRHTVPGSLRALDKALEELRRLSGITLPEEPIKLQVLPAEIGKPRNLDREWGGEALTDDTKRLLMAMQWGILIQNANGHRWIEADQIDLGDGKWDTRGLDCCPGPLDRLLREKGFEPVRSKCYGDFRAALATIDAALAELGEPSLLMQYEKRGGDSAWGLHSERQTCQCPDRGKHAAETGEHAAECPMWKPKADPTPPKGSALSTLCGCGAESTTVATIDKLAAELLGTTAGVHRFCAKCRDVMVARANEPAIRAQLEAAKPVCGCGAPATGMVVLEQPLALALEMELTNHVCDSCRSDVARRVQELTVDEE
jgi:hypothetical protein